MIDIDDVVTWCSSRKYTRELRTGSSLRNGAGTVMATVLKEDNDGDLEGSNMPISRIPLKWRIYQPQETTIYPGRGICSAGR